MSTTADLEPPKHLRHPGPADAKVASESGLGLESASVKKGLIMAGEFERIAAFFRGCRSLRFGVNGTVPGDDRDDGCST